MRTGRIYKIISAQVNECYVGSTFNTLRDRFKCHKSSYNIFKKYGTGAKLSSYDLFDKYGIDNCRIVLIKEYEMCDKSHMEAYEQLWIKKLNSINKANSFYIYSVDKKIYYEQDIENIANKIKKI